MRKGSSGEDVRELQKLLSSLGYWPGAADGEFGPATEAALKEAQIEHGLPPTGEFGFSSKAVIGSSIGRKAMTDYPATQIERDLTREVVGSVVGPAGVDEYSAQISEVAPLTAFLSALPKGKGLDTASLVSRFFLYKGVREVGSTNRGGWVDFLRHVGGGIPDKAGPWCAHYSSAVAVLSRRYDEAGVAPSPVAQIRTSGGAIRLLHKNPSLFVPAADLFPSDPEEVERLLYSEDVPPVDVAGMIFGRVRTGDPEWQRNRNKAAAGDAVPGHSGVLLGWVRLPDDETGKMCWNIQAVAGNSSGSGHSSGSGGRVAREFFGPANAHSRRAMECLVGAVRTRQ